MEKRVIIAVILSIAVLYGYSYLVPQPVRKVEPGKPSTQPLSVESTGVVPEKVAPPPTASGSSEPVRDVTVETDLYTAVFSSRGGSLKNFVLKNFREQEATGGRQVTLIAEEAPELFSLKSAGKGISIDPTTICRVNSEGFTVAGGDKRELEFVCGTPQGNTIRKSYIIHGNDYGIELKQQVINSTAARQEGALQLVLNSRVGDVAKESRFEVHGPVTLTGKDVDTLKQKDLEKGPKRYDKEILWTGYADKYFLSAVVGTPGAISSVDIRDLKGHVENTITSAPIILNAGEAATLSYRLYFGPKDLDILKAQGNQLDEVIDLGWFSMVAKPLLQALKFFYQYVHNYGIAIIIVTVIIKILFYPLTYKSYKSMKEMQKIQPKMAELKEKYKNDRDAMNRAVMELYKTHKVNPLGGCLPMLVQMPIFIALYNALMSSIELRHAPFMLWIQDLSTKDPYYVTPIIMGATMFIQQKMTPATGMDPVQAKMMLALPVVFTVMFINMPAGLVLYWLVNNILTIAQQMYINKLLKE